MFEIRVHGRGGQGVVTTAELLARAAFEDGRHAQAFPTFGSERTGSPVVAFCRIDDRPIRIHEPIAQPGALMVLDPTLVHQVRLFEGVAPDTYLLVNTTRTFTDLGLDDLVDRLQPARAMTVPASDIAREVLGRPLPNTALVGAFAALTGVVTRAAVTAAVEQTFTGSLAELNVLAAVRAYVHVLAHTSGVGRA